MDSAYSHKTIFFTKQKPEGIIKFPQGLCRGGGGVGSVALDPTQSTKENENNPHTWLSFQLK